MSEARNRSVVEGVCASIMRAVLDGRLVPGARLEPERELAISLEVSRVSVRAAVRQLVAWGVVTTRQGSGATVRSRSQWRIGAFASVLEYGLRKGDLNGMLPLLRDAFELRRSLVVDLIERAATRFDGSRPGALDATREHLRNAFEHRDDTPAFQEHDDRVMASLLEAADMEASLWLVNSLFAPYREAIAAAMARQPVPDSYLARNLTVVDAVEAGDRETARREQAAYLDELDAAFAAELPALIERELGAGKE
jgi:GntR family transcriptional repressor for pyruvate dehydrogenase complex